MMPRFRGRSFEVEGGWSWEILCTLLGDNNGWIASSKDIFKTKEEAIKDMKVHIQKACDSVQEEAMGYSTGEYIDIQTNEKRKWDKSDEN